ncbi:MAG: hypothetical protein R3351_01180 [Nitrospirales bacterium]|nr:hypothetical protein [Nitrospirales bacterium]
MGSPQRICLLVLMVFIVALESCAVKTPRPGIPDVDTRIRFYSNKVSQHPRLHQAYALLAVAYLDKARETFDPAFLTKAAVNLEHSLKIQPNFLAFKTMTALSNFRHRFDQALGWGKRAKEASPNDTSVTALLVEAYMGLGQYEEAAKLLPSPGSKPGDFYEATSLGQWLASQLRYNEAVDAYLEAASFADTEGVTELVVWAEIRAAGAFIDWGHPGLAQPHLENAKSLNCNNRVIRRELEQHWAELDEAEGRLEDALDRYELLLEEQNLADIRHKAFLLGRWLHKGPHAQGHFIAAEEGFKMAIDAGEVYTLGSLARLYADADVNLERALSLAQENMKFKRDIEAEATLHYIRSKLWFPKSPRRQSGIYDSEVGKQ